MHLRQLYADLPDPVVFMTVPVRTSGRVYDDFLRLIFFHPHREDCDLVGEMSNESDQFRFLCSSYLST